MSNVIDFKQALAEQLLSLQDELEQNKCLNAAMQQRSTEHQRLVQALSSGEIQSEKVFVALFCNQVSIELIKELFGVPSDSVRLRDGIRLLEDSLKQLRMNGHE